MFIGSAGPVLSETRFEEPFPVPNEVRSTLISSGSSRSSDLSEWADLSITIDGNPTDWVGKYTARDIGVMSEDVDLYMANDDTYLYICVDARSDTVNESSENDTMVILFDGDNSDNATNRTDVPYSPNDIDGNVDSWVTVCGNSSAVNSEGTEITDCHNDAGYLLMDPGSDTLLLVHNDNAWIDEWNYLWSVDYTGSPAHMVYELRIPISLWDWETADIVGGMVVVFKEGMEYPIGMWPAGVWSDPDDMGSWGDFFLSSENVEPDITGAIATPETMENNGVDTVILTVEAGDSDGSIDRVVIDLSDIDGDAETEMLDDGSGSDGTANDGIYNYETTIPTSVTPGEYSFSFTVYDDHLPNVGTATGSIELTILRENNDPEFLRVNETDISESISVSLTAYEDIENVFSFLAEDEDDDKMSYSLNIDEVIFGITEGADYQFDTMSGLFSISPKQDHVGLHELRIDVSDGKGGADHRDIQFDIRNSNDAPVLEKIGEQSTLQDQWLTVSPQASDEDVGDVLSFSTNFTDMWEGASIDSFFTFNDKTGEFRFRPDKTMVRTFSTYIRVEDLNNASHQQDFRINVVDVNDLPDQPSFNFSVVEYDPTVYVRADRGSDPDLDSLIYIWNFGDGSSNESGENLLEAEHIYKKEDTYTIELTLMDAVGGTSSVSKEVTVSFPMLTGKVTDERERSIPNANISIISLDDKDGKYPIFTDSNGLFSISLFPGNYNLTIKNEGYGTFEKELNVKRGITTVNITITTIPGPDDPTPRSTSSGGSGWWVYCLLSMGLLMFAAAIVIMIFMMKRRKEEEEEDDIQPTPGLPDGYMSPSSIMTSASPSITPSPPPSTPRPPFPSAMQPYREPFPNTPNMFMESSDTGSSDTDPYQYEEESQGSEKKIRSKPKIVSGTASGTALKKEEEKQIEVIRVPKKKKEEDIDEIFGDTSQDKPVIIQTEQEKENENSPKQQENGEELVDSLRNMADILKSFSERRNR